MLKKSVGIFERALRGLLGMTLALVVLFGVGGVAGIVMMVLGIALIPSAVTGICLVYDSFGINAQETS
ncbi:MAG: DUF2892 domain-containing protein [Pseudomonadota bacterium]